MTRDQLVGWFDKCFGIETAPEWQRTKFFDWVMDQQQRAQQSVERTPSEIGGAKPEFVVFDEISETGK
jgi:hypothetical protein